MTDERMVQVRNQDGECELITEQEFYAKVRWERTDADQYRPKCCGGLGYVRMMRPLGDPMFGQTMRCEKCRPAVGQ